MHVVLTFPMSQAATEKQANGKSNNITQGINEIRVDQGQNKNSKKILSHSLEFDLEKQIGENSLTSKLT